MMTKELIQNTEEYISNVAFMGKLSFIQRSQQKYLTQNLKNTEFIYGDIKLLMPLLKYNEASQEDLANTYGLNKSTVSNSIKRLEKQGLIKKIINPENRRKNKINLTDKGEKTAKEIIQLNKEWEEQILKDTNPLFFKELNKIANNCLNNLNSYNQEK